jgi:rRNA maturation endonuclease Nob1
MYKTDFYNSRYFNNITKDNDILIKSSSNIEKIISEYHYYYNLPEEKQRFFVQPFELNVSNSLASYKMELINYKNLADLFYSDHISSKSFELVLDHINEFKKNTYVENYILVKEQSKELVIEKTKNRIKDFKEYNYLLDKIIDVFEKYQECRKTWNVVLSHGDLCLSNIIWIKEINMIRFIDPRGVKKQNDMYLDEYYDLAKLSHSIFGGYESIIYNKKIDYENIKKTFINFLIEKNICVDLLKVYEASLFLSMVPLHIDNKKNINSFLSTCQKILNEVDCK